MLPAADTALDLGLLECVLLLLHRALFLLLASLVVCAHLKHDIFSHARGVSGWARRFAFFYAKFCPSFALCYSGVHYVFDDSLADAACRLDFPAGVV